MSRPRATVPRRRLISAKGFLREAAQSRQGAPGHHGALPRPRWGWGRVLTCSSITTESTFELVMGGRYRFLDNPRRLVLEVGVGEAGPHLDLVES